MRADVSLPTSLDVCRDSDPPSLDVSRTFVAVSFLRHSSNSIATSRCFSRYASCRHIIRLSTRLPPVEHDARGLQWSSIELVRQAGVRTSL